VPERGSKHYERKLDGILRQSAEIFCAQGYHQASIRDIARATGTSLAGLYYYFSSKEQLLYLIQRHAFETLLKDARAALVPLPDAEQRLRAFVQVHLEYFLHHPNEMKVLTHEERSLDDKLRREIHALKKSYYQLCLNQVEALKLAKKVPRLNTRVAVLLLFGMMNWLYTWYNPQVDPDARTLAQQVTETFLRGAFGGRARGSNHRKESHIQISHKGSRHPARRLARQKNSGRKNHGDDSNDYGESGSHQLPRRRGNGVD
jgi:AcrR family transcriptional regulator